MKKRFRTMPQKLYAELSSGVGAKYTHVFSTFWFALTFAGFSWDIISDYDGDCAAWTYNGKSAPEKEEFAWRWWAFEKIEFVLMVCAVEHNGPAKQRLGETMLQFVLKGRL